MLVPGWRLLTSTSWTTEDDRLVAGSISSTSISTEDSSEHEPDLYPTSKTSKAILTLDIAKGVMYSSSSLAAKRGASRAQSTAVAIPRFPLFSVSSFSLLFSLFFCLLYFKFCLTWRAESEDVKQQYCTSTYTSTYICTYHGYSWPRAGLATLRGWSILLWYK